MVPIFVINLPQSRRRRRAVTRSLRRVGVSDYEIVRAVDGSMLEACDVERATRLGGYLHPTPAMVGCSISHRNVRRRFAESGASAAAILEDDCVPSARFADAVEEIAASLSG